MAINTKSNAILLKKDFQLISVIPLVYGELRTYAKYISQDKTLNRTSYSLEARYYCSSAGGISFSSGSLNLDGITKNLGFTTFPYGETLIQEVTRLLVHEDDGTSPAVVVETTWNATFGGSGSAKAEITMPDIKRIAKIESFSGTDLESNFVVDYTKYVNDFTYKLRVSIPKVKRLMTIDNYETGTNVMLDEESLNYIKNYMNEQRRNVVSIGMVIETWSKDGSTKVGESEELIKPFGFTNAEPTFTYTKEEINLKVVNVLESSSAETIVKNASKLKVIVEPQAYKGATISGVSITGNGTTQTITKSPYQFELNMETDNFIISVIDIRGNTAEQVVSMNMLDYISVKINSFEFVRENPTSSNIKLEMNADFIQETYNKTINQPLVQWKLNENGTLNTIPSEEYVIDQQANKITLNTIINNVLDYRQKGMLYLYVSDIFTEASDSMEVIKGIPTFDAGEHDLCVNGYLYVANEDGENKIDVLSRYSTEEVPIGYWIDGRIIYRKVVNTGKIESKEKTIYHAISNIKMVTNMRGILISSSGNWYSLPRVSGDKIETQLGLNVTPTNIVITTGTNANFADSYVILEYTKK